MKNICGFSTPRYPRTGIADSDVARQIIWLRSDKKFMVASVH